MKPDEPSTESKINGKIISDVESKNDGCIFSMIIRFSDGSHADLFVSTERRFEHFMFDYVEAV